MEPKIYTLKVNIRAQEEKERRQKERQTREAISKLQPLNAPPAPPRKRRGLNFHKPGTFIQQAEQIRKRAKLEALQKRIAATAAKTGIADAAKLATLTTDTSSVVEKKTDKKLEVEVQEESVPEIEWWDKAILGKQSIDKVIPKLSQQLVKPEAIFLGITNLVEHPPIKKPPGPDTSTIQVPIFLTASERKKLRRQNRKNQELERQEKIKLGLLPKPEPKLKRATIMYALGDEAINNPSLANQLVKAQEEKRLKAHIEHNESKKLSLEEKREKKLRKIKEDLSVTGVWVSIYRIISLSKQSRKLKIIEQKVKELTMTGTICLTKTINLVLVEGGPKQQRKFKRLIMNRLKWSEEIESSEISPNANRCLLVWEGQVGKKSFNYFKVRHFSDEFEAKSYFREFNIEHYWDLAYKLSILESINDT